MRFISRRISVEFAQFDVTQGKLSESFDLLVVAKNLQQ